MHHVADSFASIAHTIDQLAKSVVSLQGAIQVHLYAAFQTVYCVSAYMPSMHVRTSQVLSACSVHVSKRERQFAAKS